MLRRLLPDRFILFLIATILLAWRFPVSSAPAAIVDVVTYVAIFALFFLHGARMPREALIAGFSDLKLHGAILLITFGIFPVLGLIICVVLGDALDPMVRTGLLFLCCIPSTVQSSIAYTSMAGGNVPGAVAGAAFSNMAGVFLTPLLAAFIVGAEEAAITFDGVLRIFGLLFLPFLLGHAMRPLIWPLLEKRPALTTFVDKGTILLAVYGAFSAAVVDRIFTRIPLPELALLIGVILFMLACVLGAATVIGRVGRFPYGSRMAILFCGSVKSLASGAPMAKVLFPGSATALVLVPVMLYHTLQLVVCASIAGALMRKRILAEQAEKDAAVSAEPNAPGA